MKKKTILITFLIFLLVVSTVGMAISKKDISIKNKDYKIFTISKKLDSKQICLDEESFKVKNKYKKCDKNTKDPDNDFLIKYVEEDKLYLIYYGI